MIEKIVKRVEKKKSVKATTISPYRKSIEKQQ